MKELQYPFNADLILKKRKSIKRTLLSQLDVSCPKIKIAVLGGSTTKDIKDILELFLLNAGIVPQFYESEYNQYWQDVIFENPKLVEFHPDIIYIHSSNRNIPRYPVIQQSEKEVDNLLEEVYKHFFALWEKIKDDYGSVIIQNNFEYPYFRPMGNCEAYDIHGKINFLNRLNQKFSEYAQRTDDFYINDINYMSSIYGLKEWSNPFYWYMYKYILCIPAIPEFSYNLANIIKSLYGKKKKAIAVDLDNCLWGGVVGEDGPDGLVIGPEEAMGEAYMEFQRYISGLKEMGILLTVNSKNDYENAIAGLKHPYSQIAPEDFQIIKANWRPKSQNLREIVDELNILEDSIVFVDDNPAECEEVCQQLPGAAVVKLSSVENYIEEVDRNGYFEVTDRSIEDQKRNQMYRDNIKRQEASQAYQNYSDYLISLKMRAVIEPFKQAHIGRITQLVNKTNQFNLTTKRYSKTEIDRISKDDNYIHLYGKLEDKFGDNGIVTVIIGRKEQDVLHIELWIMSCRVLKREMETAMMDALIKSCKEKDIAAIKGYYYPTAKNSMVKDFFGQQGFEKVSGAEGKTEWLFEINDIYIDKNHLITIKRGEGNEM
jgi:FkbH-like protein